MFISLSLVGMSSLLKSLISEKSATIPKRSLMLLRLPLAHMMMGGLIFVVIGCHSHPRPTSFHTNDGLSWDDLSPQNQRNQLVSKARKFLKHKRKFRIQNRKFPADCSGFIGAVLLQSGIDVFAGASELKIKGNGVKILQEFVTRYGENFESDFPKPGDLVFFSNTYDRNQDGQPNDILTHVGIIEKIDTDGTIYFLNRVQKGVRRYAINLLHPNKHKNSNQKLLNSFLRRRTPRDRKNTSYLSGALFAGFGTLIKSQKALKPIASN